MLYLYNSNTKTKQYTNSKQFQRSIPKFKSLEINETNLALVTVFYQKIDQKKAILTTCIKSSVL